MYILVYTPTYCFIKNRKMINSNVIEKNIFKNDKTHTHRKG